MIYDSDSVKTFINTDNVEENSPYWYISQHITNKQKILDIGCATGYFGSYLKNNFNADVVGVDYLDYHINEAKKLEVYSDLIKLDLNSFTNELEKYTSYFDRIILADVLEHLINPMEVLTKLSKLLKDDGEFLIDVPNIAHSTIKYNLLSNDFKYTPMGLLDNTHIHFFTINSLINELSENKFIIEDMEFIFLSTDQTYDQDVDYSRYTPEIIDFIENDNESYIYQIFVVFKKSNLNTETLIKHNKTFKNLNKKLITKKEKYAPITDNKNLKSLKDRIKEKDAKISRLKATIKSNDKIIISKNSTIIKMRSSHSWKITKPIRSLTLSLKKLKKINSNKKKTSKPLLKNQEEIPHPKETDDLLNIVYTDSTESYVKKSDRFFKREAGDVNLIAFYLPQFHTIEENDEWWGNGFTEWTNVTRAVPQIEGHYQPHLPDELGFYDLSNNDIFYKQIELAKKYGIHGFCFHYYWFSGKRILEKPIFNYLEDKELDFPFMLCWANEPWSRRWDGSEQDILMPQNLNEDDHLKFIEDIMPFFKDDRYIKIDNCPMLMIYRPQYFPQEELNAAIELWRNYVKQNGFKDLHLINAESHNFDPNDKADFNASVQFFPNYTCFIKDENAVIFNPKFTGNVYDLEAFVKGKSYLEDHNYMLYRSVVPSWDNTARTMSKALILNNSSPELYQEWLTDVINYTKKNFSVNNQFVFINAWNEWAEAAHLEPDRKYGFAYLEATLNALKKNKEIKL